MTFVFLDDSYDPAGGARLFTAPREEITAWDADGVEAALERLTAAAAAGHYAAGFMSYEAGLVFEPRLAPLMPPRGAMPLLWFGIFDAPEIMDRAQALAWLAQHEGEYNLTDIRAGIGPDAYAEKIAQTLDYIGSGDIYQLNYTFKAKFAFSGSPIALYRDLRRKQKVPYGGIISTPGFQILSLSPELFLRVEGRAAETRPMKGTARRGVNAAEDAALSAWLASDIKSRAENLMIVDLMRNDLGRVAETGSVHVSDLFTVETFQTVLQMTSGVHATLREDTDFRTLTHAIYPPGSITGAPKVRAMEIISELEDEPRGVYTGALGLIQPGGDCVFNVAIRTLVLDGQGRGEIGIGSGIVQDSLPQSEYEECLLKMRFLTDPPADFQLVETFRWDRDGGYALLERHLARLAASAAHFLFTCDIAAVREALDTYAAGLDGSCHRVRLTLAEDGAIAITSTPLALPPAIPSMRYAIAQTRMQTDNVFLYHKTTRRAFLDGERERLAKELNCQEVVFLNERGELTEGSFTNIFLETAAGMLTPALTCGLLAGTLRQDLIETGRAREAVLHLEDLTSASAVWLGNSVRGLMRAEAVDAFIVEASALRPRPAEGTALEDQGKTFARRQ
jgi:para-aminobenzoate synthetase/4-amino-4-deoxychorismate lyase